MVLSVCLEGGDISLVLDRSHTAYGVYRYEATMPH